MKKRKALILDTTTDVQTVLAMKLEFQGYDCRKALDTETALNLMTEEAPDIIVLGYSLNAKENANFIQSFQQKFGMRRTLPTIIVLGAYSEKKIPLAGAQPVALPGALPGAQNSLAHIVVKSYQSHPLTHSVDESLRACA